MISADILLKGLGGVAVVGGATGMGVCYHHKLWIFAEGENLKTMGEKVGLDCSGTNGQKEETGVDCTIKDGGLSVKQGDTSKDTGKKKNTTQTSTPEGKIRGYKDGKGFKFVIEEGDIALTGGTASATNISKLEQFETYEIKEDGGDKKQYLTRKNDSRKEIKLALGLPETDCDLPDSSSTTKTCTLDEGKIKKINFDGKPSTGLTLGEGETTTISLKISKPSADENTIFPHGYKFELQSNKDITLDTSKVIKKGTNTEFKIKVTPASGGPKVLTLEKAWTVKSLGAKVGLDCPETVTSGTAGECSLTASKVNVKNGTETNKKLENHSKKDDNDNKKVKVEIDQESHNQGFKFYAEEDICLKDSSNSSDDNKKIEGKGSATPITYEIKKDTDNKWYLTKKNGTPT